MAAYQALVMLELQVESALRRMKERLGSYNETRYSLAMSLHGDLILFDSFPY